MNMIIKCVFDDFFFILFLVFVDVIPISNVVRAMRISCMTDFSFHINIAGNVNEKYFILNGHTHIVVVCCT